jgi:hypothetical protein
MKKISLIILLIIITINCYSQENAVGKDIKYIRTKYSKSYVQKSILRDDTGNYVLSFVKYISNDSISFSYEFGSDSICLKMYISSPKNMYNDYLAELNTKYYRVDKETWLFIDKGKYYLVGMRIIPEFDYIGLIIFEITSEQKDILLKNSKK